MSDDAPLFHLSGIMLRRGSIIEPGNFGRIIRATGSTHPKWDTEQALEAARVVKHRSKPSRLEAAFVSVNEAEARSFRSRIPGFTHHMLYRVSTCNPNAPSHLTDTRLSGPQSALQYDWAALYWSEYDPEKIIIPGKGTLSLASGGVPCREMLTLSALKIQDIIA